MISQKKNPPDGFPEDLDNELLDEYPPIRLLLVASPISSLTVVSRLPSGCTIVISLLVTLRPSGVTVVVVDSERLVPPPPDDENDEEEKDDEKLLLIPPPSIPILEIPELEKKGSFEKGSEKKLEPKGFLLLIE